MIVIPMAGASKRFFQAGYVLPKYQLMLGSRPVFNLVIESFRHYFCTDPFLFIVRPDHDAPEFVRHQLAASGIRRYEIFVLDRETAGQAETVHCGASLIPAEEPVYIFNIDTIRSNYRKPAFINEVDGYLEVFEGSGEHWSFVAPAPGQRVARTAEKDRISSLCSDGLYYFRNKSLFLQSYEAAITARQTVQGEWYIAPLYNHLIAQQLDVRYDVIDCNDITFCGTPLEYQRACSMLRYQESEK